LTRCVRWVTYRVSKWFWCSGMYSCVCVSDWFREQDIKNYRKCLAVICYVRSVCTTLL